MPLGRCFPSTFNRPNRTLHGAHAPPSPPLPAAAVALLTVTAVMRMCESASCELTLPAGWSNVRWSVQAGGWDVEDNILTNQLLLLGFIPERQKREPLFAYSHNWKPYFVLFYLFYFFYILNKLMFPLKYKLMKLVLQTSVATLNPDWILICLCTHLVHKCTYTTSQKFGRSFSCIFSITLIFVYTAVSHWRH